MSVSGAVPPLATVTDCGAESVPWRCGPNTSAAVERVAWGATPVPESATVRGPSSPSSVSVAVRGPTAEGRKAMAKVAPWATASESGALAGVTRKSAGSTPVSVKPSSSSVSVPPLVTTRDCEAEAVAVR